MQKLGALILLSLAALLLNGPQASAWQQRSAVIVRGASFGSRPVFVVPQSRVVVVPQSRVIVVPRPFFERHAFVSSPFIVERPIFVQRRPFRRQFFIFDGFGHFD
jgi:hypothetical protein